MRRNDVLVKKYFQEHSQVNSSIISFNNFLEKELQQIVDELGNIEPTIIPHNVEEFKIKFDKIRVGKPEITEADGSRRPIYPVEARLRKISYAAPVYLSVSAHINGVQRENFETQIGMLPIMLKSNHCHLNGLNREELIKKGEDPDDTGGYFVINGSEKALITIEDLAPNQVLVERQTVGISEFIAKLFSEKGSYKIPHTMERLKDGIYYITFTRVKRVPVIVVLKALGMLKDEEIMKTISDQQFDEVLLNLYEFTDIKTLDDALDSVARKTGIAQTREIRIERVKEILTRYFMPHIGDDEKDNLEKARNLCKMLKKFIMASNGQIELDDKDHYKNKRLKLAGDLLADLLRVNMKVLIGDMLYNFQRIVKRGKFPSIRVTIRDNLLTQRIYSSMATGNWVGGRKGISQRIQRLNHLDMLSHLQRIVSPLSSSQENFAARALHPTHLGRLCPIETPEGTNIGLRKNMALFVNVSRDEDNEQLLKILKTAGLKQPKVK